MATKDFRAVLITGASSGIGEALAEHYATKGATLFLTGRNTERLETVAETCRTKGAVVVTKTVDVTDKQAMAQFIGEAFAKHPLDLVVANAGISRGTATDAAELSAQTRLVTDINIVGVLNTVLPALPLMEENGGGQVGLVSSLAGFRGLATAPVYSASKAFVKAWGEGLRVPLAKRNIGISVICPGFVRSRITDANTCPMPFFMEADKAAKIIAKGLAQNKGSIVFPWQMGFVLWLLAALPRIVSDAIIAALPEKNA